MSCGDEAAAACTGGDLTHEPQDAGERLESIRAAGALAVLPALGGKTRRRKAPVAALLPLPAQHAAMIVASTSPDGGGLPALTARPPRVAAPGPRDTTHSGASPPPIVEWGASLSSRSPDAATRSDVCHWPSTSAAGTKPDLLVALERSISTHENVLAHWREPPCPSDPQNAPECITGAMDGVVPPSASCAAAAQRAQFRLEMLRESLGTFKKGFRTYGHVFEALIQATKDVAGCIDAHRAAGDELYQTGVLWMRRSEELQLALEAADRSRYDETVQSRQLQAALDESEEGRRMLRALNDDLQRQIARLKDSTEEALERADALSKQHVVSTMKEERQRQTIDHLERQAANANSQRNLSQATLRDKMIALETASEQLAVGERKLRGAESQIVALENLLMTRNEELKMLKVTVKNLTRMVAMAAANSAKNNSASRAIPPSLPMDDATGGAAWVPPAPLAIVPGDVDGCSTPSSPNRRGAIEGAITPRAGTSAGTESVPPSRAADGASSPRLRTPRPDWNDLGKKLLASEPHVTRRKSTAGPGERRRSITGTSSQGPQGDAGGRRRSLTGAGGSTAGERRRSLTGASAEAPALSTRPPTQPVSAQPDGGFFPAGVSTTGERVQFLVSTIQSLRADVAVGAALGRDNDAFRQFLHVLSSTLPLDMLQVPRRQLAPASAANVLVTLAPGPSPTAAVHDGKGEKGAAARAARIPNAAANAEHVFIPVVSPEYESENADGATRPHADNRGAMLAAAPVLLPPRFLVTYAGNNHVVLQPLTATHIAAIVQHVWHFAGVWIQQKEPFRALDKWTGGGAATSGSSAPAFPTQLHQVPFADAFEAWLESASCDECFASWPALTHTTTAATTAPPVASEGLAAPMPDDEPLHGRPKFSTSTADADARLSRAYSIVYHAQLMQQELPFAQIFVAQLCHRAPRDTFVHWRRWLRQLRNMFEECDVSTSEVVTEGQFAQSLKTHCPQLTFSERQALLFVFRRHSVTYAEEVSGPVDPLWHIDAADDDLLHEGDPNLRVPYASLFAPHSAFVYTATGVFAQSMFRAHATFVDVVVSGLANNGASLTQANSSTSLPSSSPNLSVSSAGNQDVQVGALLQALAQSDPGADGEAIRAFVNSCLGVTVHRAAKVPLALLVDRIPGVYWRRASPPPSSYAGVGAFSVPVFTYTALALQASLKAGGNKSFRNVRKPAAAANTAPPPPGSGVETSSPAARADAAGTKKRKTVAIPLSKESTAATSSS